MSVFDDFEIIFQREKYVIPEEIDKSCLLPTADLQLHYLPIKRSKFLASGEDVKTVLEVTFDNSETNFDFEAGDVISIFPINNADEVDRLISRLNANDTADSVYEIKEVTHQKDSGKKLALPKHIPRKGSLRCSFTHFVDIRRVLSKKLITVLANFTTNEDVKNSILNLAKDRTLYHQNVLEANLSILDFLENFPACRPPVEVLLENLPQLSPRPYSICSSSRTRKDEFRICFSILSFANNKKGLTTGWLEAVTNKELSKQSVEIDFHNLCSLSDDKKEVIFADRVTAPMYFKRSKFRLASDSAVPVVMICNGTGVAPFVGFLAEIREIKKNRPDEKYCTALYYGCRYRSKDYLYKKEIESYLQNGALGMLRLAHSRENDECHKYVQDCLQSDESKLFEIANRDAIIYVCGSNVMVKEVEKFFVTIFSIKKQLSAKDAQRHIKDLKAQNRYIMDVWE